MLQIERLVAQVQMKRVRIERHLPKLSEEKMKDVDIFTHSKESSFL